MIKSSIEDWQYHQAGDLLQRAVHVVIELAEIHLIEIKEMINFSPLAMKWNKKSLDIIAYGTFSIVFQIPCDKC